jgi:ABC-type Fe3+ transport system substrate-binding protein
MDRREFMVGSAVAAAGLYAGAARATEPWEDLLAKLYPAAKQDGEFVFNSERIEEVGGKDGIAQFSKRYPGVKVTFAGMAGSELPSRIASEAKAGKVSIDIFRADPDRAQPIFERGFLMKIDPKEISVDPVATYLDDHFIKLSDHISNFAYNTDLLKPADLPKSYEDLLAPKWKGRLVLDARGGQIAHLLSEKIWDEKKFWDFVDALKKQDPIWTTRNTEAMSKIVSGEGLVGTGSYDAVEQMKATGAPIEFLFVSPSLSQVRGAAIVQGAAHPNAAKLFLGWLLSPEGLKVRDKNAVGTISPGTDLYEKVQARGAQIVFEKDIDQIMARDAVGEQITKRWGVLK